MKKFKTISGIAIWATLLWLGLSKVSTGMHDEIVDTLTIRNNGCSPSEHQIVTYYYERYAK